MNLKDKTISALAWSAVDRIGSRGIQFVISIILARLLLPEQFGLIAMLTIFFAIAQTFIDSGFGAALIQKQDADHVDECSIFYFNIFVGFLLAGIIYLSAPYIATFYEQPMLAPLTRFMSISLIVGAFSIIQATLLSKNLDFKTQTKISILAAIISGAIGVYLAYQDFGVWALAVQQVLSGLLQMVMLWFWFAWRPSLVFSFESLHQMFGYGSRMLASGLLDTVFKNLYLIVIGKAFPPAELGYYTRAQGFPEMISLNFSQILSRVTFPVFSSIQYETERLKRAVRKSLTLSALVIFPAMIGMAVVAEPLVLLLLTDKWLPAVPYLQLLCIVKMFLPLHVFNLSVLKSKGRSDLFLRLEIIKKVLVVLNIAITWRWGVEAMIIGQIVLQVNAYFLNSYVAGRLIAYPPYEQLKDLLPALAVSILMGALVLTMGRYINTNSLVIDLICQVGVGVFAYIAFCKCFGIAMFDDLVFEIRQKLKR